MAMAAPDEAPWLGSPLKLGGREARTHLHVAPDDSFVSSAPRPSQHSSPVHSLAGRAHTAGRFGDGAARVSAEIDVLRATQAARAALASQRGGGLRGEPPALGHAPGVDLSPSEAELFDELGYLRQERDLVFKEKRTLQHLLSQAGEEIRALVAAEQRHVEAQRSWVLQRDELLLNKAQGEQLNSICDALRQRLEEVLDQHRRDKEAWEAEVHGVLQAKANAEHAASSTRSDLAGVRQELEALRGRYDQVLHDCSQANSKHVECKDQLEAAREQLRQRDERLSSLEHERQRLVQEACACREQVSVADTAKAAADKEMSVLQREKDLLAKDLAQASKVLQMRQEEHGGALQALERECLVLRKQLSESEARTAESEALRLEEARWREREVRELRTRHECEVSTLSQRCLALQLASEASKLEVEHASRSAHELKDALGGTQERLALVQSELVQRSSEASEASRSMAVLEAELAKQRLHGSRDRAFRAELKGEMTRLQHEAGLLFDSGHCNAASTQKGGGLVGEDTGAGSFPSSLKTSEEPGSSLPSEHTNLLPDLLMIRERVLERERELRAQEELRRQGEGKQSRTERNGPHSPAHSHATSPKKGIPYKHVPYLRL